VNAIRMTLIIAVPCAVGLMALAKPVTMLLFPQWDTLDTASLLLAELAVTVIFYSVGTIMNAVLQSIGRIHMPLVSAGIALAIQTVVLVIMITTTDLGVHALVLCSVLYSVLIFLIDSRFISKYLRMHLRIYRVYGRPVIAAAVMGVVTKLVYELIFRAGMMAFERTYLVNLIASVIAIAAAVLVYFFVLIRIGGLTREDVLQAPKGTKLLRILENIRWM
jgi:stage V sporulation protein B